MNNQLKSRIMRRVYGIWFVRRFAPTAASLGFFSYLTLHEIADKFFVSQIYANFLAVAQNMWAIPGFIGAAVTHAQPQTLFIIAFSILAVFVLSVKLLRTIRVIVAQRQSMMPGYSKFI